MHFPRRNTTVFAAALLIGAASVPAQAFDLEDYATTYRATRDAFLKAANQVRLAHQAYALYRDHAVLHGWNPRDEAWFFTPGLLEGTCESPEGVEFGTNIYGPEAGHAFADFIRTMSDVITPGVMSDLLGDQELVGTWFRAMRDYYQRLVNQAVIAANVPLLELESQCVDQVYYQDMEDLLTTLRASRDAYLKAMNEWALAIAPYKAALAAYTAATKVYTYGINCEPGSDLNYLNALPRP